ncbi:MAG: hypothetical protein EOP02_09435 [Proteobacteria bacterium]|nr:MAG: hypothetical protein EOP02_09435 [Pseudomonadota bacterium]
MMPLVATCLAPTLLQRPSKGNVLPFRMGTGKPVGNFFVCELLRQTTNREGQVLEKPVGHLLFDPAGRQIAGVFRHARAASAVAEGLTQTMCFADLSCTTVVSQRQIKRYLLRTIVDSKTPSDGLETSQEAFVILDLQKRPIGGVFFDELEALYAIEAFYLTKALEDVLNTRLPKLSEFSDATVR